MSHNPTLHDTIDPHDTLSIQEAFEDHHHVTPFWPMFWVFSILLVLTALTVWSSNIHHFWIGNTEIHVGSTAHILMALVIATVKAILVGMYFMHLKYDSPMNTAVVAATIFGVLLFIGLTLADSTTRSAFDSGQHQKVMAGGDSHRAPDGSFVKGTGVVAAAKANAKAHGSNPDADHAADDHSTSSAKPAGGH